MDVSEAVQNILGISTNCRHFLLAFDAYLLHLKITSWGWSNSISNTIFFLALSQSGFDGSPLSIHQYALKTVECFQKETKQIKKNASFTGKF